MILFVFATYPNYGFSRRDHHINYSVSAISGTVYMKYETLALKFITRLPEE